MVMLQYVNVSNYIAHLTCTLYVKYITVKKIRFLIRLDLVFLVNRQVSRRQGPPEGDGRGASRTPHTGARGPPRNSSGAFWGASLFAAATTSGSLSQLKEEHVCAVFSLGCTVKHFFRGSTELQKMEL